MKLFVLTFNINAGKRYKFKKIFANVSETLDKSAFASLEKEFNKLVGHYYSQRKLKKVLEKIDKLSEQKELQFINHNILETLDENGVEVVGGFFNSYFLDNVDRHNRIFFDKKFTSYF